ncbi:hypothetical protein FOE78_12270 [Microlunatus elymi]|uniref:Ribbon-helix-helix protein, copG family n=1 Tax=Microlunatus elymi TaxID=2596828 RepID=A0A516PZI9_9ACTN|nr:hypothetical protein [Microlunatus elymi]QDP96578.1 hypothetical protein FOE78_12270 [Microlunatus elymi]
MKTEIIQVREVPATEVAVLRQRAAERGVSLSQYLRELIHDQVSRPSMTEVIGRISSRDRVEVHGDEIRASIDDGRR